LRSISDQEFETTLLDMFARLGYHLAIGPDGPIKDGTFYKNNEKYAMHYARHPADKLMLVLLARVVDNKNAKKGFFVVTGSLAPDAVEYAEKAANIQLIDGTELVRLMRISWQAGRDGIEAMCAQCADIVAFDDTAILYKQCKNGHSVKNPLLSR